jgi:hypothetical protein
MGAGKGQRDGYANLLALQARITDSLVKKLTLHAPGVTLPATTPRPRVCRR